jgi:hypothetical protein
VEDDARRAHWRALRSAHAGESVPRVLMRWDTAAHGAPPAPSTTRDWDRADAARPVPTGVRDSADGAQ